MTEALAFAPTTRDTTSHAFDAATPWRVLKFGGTSVAMPETIATITREVAAAARTHRVVVVPSALVGVTDAIESLIVRTLAGRDDGQEALTVLRHRHASLLDAVARGAAARWAEAEISRVLRQLEAGLGALRLTRAADAHERARLLAAGERLSQPIIVAALLTQGLSTAAVAADALLRAEGYALDAEPDLAASTRVIAGWRAGFAARVAVIPGFFAADRRGRLVLLGRGGSDTSATVLGAALRAERVEIWSDVDGVASADPRELPEARVLPRLSYAEAASLARHGARILHAKSIAPAIEAAVPVWVRNTRRPVARGTWIGGEARDIEAHAIDTARALAVTDTLEGAVDIAVVFASAPGDSARDAVSATLARAHVDVLALDTGWDALALRVRVPGAQRAIAVRALHEGVIAPPPRVHLALIGARGLVGTALREQLARELDGVNARLRADLRLSLALDRRGLAFDPQGLPSSLPADLLRPREPGDLEAALGTLAARVGERVIVIDCTASAEIAANYRAWLRAGIGVVTPNKLANAASQREWAALHEDARAGDAAYRYETTVGAALPVLATLRDLRERGETPRRIEAVLSGSLSFLLARLHEGATFGDAVREARALGYTEPDPREDLAGRDIARKLVILAREAGHTIEPETVRVEPLVDLATWSPDTPDALTDAYWRDRVAQARAHEARLVAVANFDGEHANVAVNEVALTSPLARLAAGENMVRISTDIHARVPITIAGPGAGPAVTAAGVLGDVISAARAAIADGRGTRPSPPSPAVASAIGAWRKTGARRDHVARRRWSRPQSS